MNQDLFEIITELTLKQDESYYDHDYGHNRFEIVNDISLLEVVEKIDRFNKQYGRKIVPKIVDNHMFIYL